MEYYVYITNNCNMNCAYCSVLFDTQKYGVPLFPEYSFGDLEKFITRTQAELDDPVADIYFFGGEPTVDYGRIHQLIEVMDVPHEYTVNFIMHTNGLLIPQAPRDIIEKVHIALLSFNYELLYEDGHLTSYFGKMLHAIESMRSVKQFPIIGRITVSPHTSLYTESCLISNFVDYIYWQIDNCERVEDFNSYSRQYKYEVTLLFKYWLECLKQGIFLRFVPFMSVVRNCLVDRQNPETFYCGYGTSMIYIQTNGKCYACCDNVATNSHYIGDIYSGVSFPENNLLNTICANCPYIKLCGGRCGRMHKDFSRERILEYCELNKYMFELVKAEMAEIKRLFEQHPEYLEKVMDPLIAYTEYTP